ncbi:MAG: sigma-54 dependent transcriptional regulator [Deferrisomatales bacterium]|nr:sigma-54 dependent transcriptional regulator [Deferrisomatales bacterium]
MPTLDVLIVEDEPTQREMLRDALRREGHRAEAAGGGEEALRLLQTSAVDVLLLDQRMPGMDGLEVLRRARSAQPEVDAVMLTAYGSVENAVAAMKAGASDYVTKPVDLDELLLLLERLGERRRLVRENEVLRRELGTGAGVAGRLLYRSSRMAEQVNLAGRVAPSRATILLRGESGTGKELFAHLIHDLSPRRAHPLVTLHCAALPEGLLESELFGHERGAFTGAVQQRRGRLEEADGSTLFLDEVGELSPSVQVKLLRFLQEGEIQRVGGNRVLRADVRVIGATHRDLEARVREGAFREDLYYRLNVVTLHIPPLRERREDLPVLIDHFAERFARENGRHLEGLSREARDLLLKYDYPGNVRELANILERAAVVSRGPWISTEDLPFGNTGGAGAGGSEGLPPGGTLREALGALERRMIDAALLEAGGNQSRAARALGLSERMLRYKLKGRRRG